MMEVLLFAVVLVVAKNQFILIGIDDIVPSISMKHIIADTLVA